MREDIYKALKAFLDRVDLKGSEVPAMNAVQHAIDECYKASLKVEEEIESDGN